MSGSNYKLQHQMHDWIMLLTINWLWTWSTHEITNKWCNLTILREVYYVPLKYKFRNYCTLEKSEFHPHAHNFINKTLMRSLHYITISIIMSKFHTYHLNHYEITCLHMINCIIYICSHTCKLYSYFEYGKVLESTVSWSPSESNNRQSGNKYEIFTVQRTQNIT